MQLRYNDVEALAKTIQEKTGLVFSYDKELDLKNAAIKTVEKFGIPTFADLLELVNDANLLSNEFKFLVESLTINETYFFRHFKTLEDYILPNLVKRKKNKSLRIWSAGCSSGEEAYSISMVLNELIPRIKEWQIYIKATDIDSSVIDIAKSGDYKKWSMRQISKYYKSKYFKFTQQNTFKIDEKIRNSVEFSIHNLLANDFPSEYSNTNGLDIVLCRNVSIYFGLDDTVRIIKQFYKCLNFGGYLIVGHSEPSPFVYDQFDHMIIGDMVIYQKNKKPLGKQSVPVLESNILRSKRDVVKIKSVPKKDNSGKSLDVVFEEAQAFYQKHDYDKALETLSYIHTRESTHIKANYLSALIYANLSKFDKALPFLNKVIDENSLHEESYYLLSLMHKENKNYHLAIETLKKALYINSAFTLAYYEIMVNYVLLKDMDEAERTYQKIRTLIKDLDDSDDVGIIEHLKVENLKSLVCIFLGKEEF